MSSEKDNESFKGRNKSKSSLRFFNLEQAVNNETVELHHLETLIKYVLGSTFLFVIGKIFATLQNGLAYSAATTASPFYGS